jgi:hypothetical protein
VKGFESYHPALISLAMSHDSPTDAQVVNLARAAFEHSLADIHRTAAETPRELQQQQPGITIDLGHKNITRLPDEVIDVISAEIERYTHLAMLAPS